MRGAEEDPTEKYVWVFNKNIGGLGGAKNKGV